LIDDGTVENLSGERLATVLAPKAEGAWNLHELTAPDDVELVLYSSAAGAFGGPGQGNYAAANVFLDALAQRRRAEGLAATSVAWGMWEQRSDLTADLDDADRSRLARIGLRSIDAARGMAMLDRARTATDASLLAVPFERAALLELSRAGLLPPLLSDLVRAPVRRSKAAVGSLARKLSSAPAAERPALVLAEVKEQIAIVLGHPSGEAIEQDRNLLELGFDSLGAVELRNRLAALADVQIEPTVAFEHPTPVALAAYLEGRLTESHGGEGGGDAASAPAGTMRTLIANAHARGETIDAVPLLVDASRFRPSFASAEQREPGGGIVLSAAGEAPRLVCLPSFVVGSGPHQFVRIARAFEGRRKLTALTLPGAARGDLLPASWSVAVDALVESTLAAAEGDPFVVLGYSSGAALAHNTVERLERRGAPVAGLAMIDAYLPFDESAGGLIAEIVGHLLEMDHDAVAIDDDHLLTMGAYARMLAEWEPGRVATPGLMLRATEDGGVKISRHGERPAWQAPATTIDVAGDHFSLIGDDAEQSAAALDSWLSQLSAAEPLVRG